MGSGRSVAFSLPPGPSLRGRLLVLSGAVGLAMLALAGFAVWEAHAAARERVEAQLRGTAQVLARVVDREFGRVEALLLGLATSPALDPLDPAAFLGQAGRVLGELDGGALVLSGPDGRQVLNTAAAPEALAAGLAQAPGLEVVFTSGRTAISDLFPGRVTGQPAIAVGVPVRREADGPVLRVLGAGLPPTRLANALGEQHLPPDWAALVLDRKGAAVARLAMAGTDALPQAGLRAGLAAVPEGDVGRVRMPEGGWAAAAFARAPRSGYAVAVMVAEAEFAAVRQAALLRTGLVGLLLALGGLGMTALLAHRVAGALHGLGPEGRPEGRPEGGVAGVPRWHLREIDDLAARLAAASAARDQAEAGLRERGEWLEASQRAAHVGTWDWDLRTGLLRWSEQQFRLHCLEPNGTGTLDAEAWRASLDPADLPRLEAAVAEARRSGSFEAEYRVHCEDGSLRWLATRAALERDAEGRPRRLLGVGIDITRRRAREDSREQQLRMKDLVVTEVHHRVKNSLQLIHGVLLMQARGAGAEAAARLRDAAARVLTIAAVHRRLYEEDAQEGTDLAIYLAGLIGDLRGSLTGAAAGADIRLEAPPGLRLSAGQLAPLGLVTTELVTNALKYGGTPVMVTCRQGETGLELAVEDAGPGFPPEFDPAKSRGLGMRLSIALARHHHGRLEIDRSAPGGRVVLILGDRPRFPPPQPDTHCPVS